MAVGAETHLMPTVSRRTALRTTALSLLAVPGRSTLTAADSQDDSQRNSWEFETDGPIEGSPTVVGGSVYVVSDERYLYAVDAETGELEWEYEAGEYEFRPELRVRIPTVVDGTVYVTSGGYANGTLHAVDVESRESRWTVTIDGEATVPTVTEDAVYLPNAGDVTAFDSQDGDRLWTHPLEQGGGLFGPAPAVVDGTVYVGGRPQGVETAPPEFHAIGADDGETSWISQARASFSAPTMVDDLVFFGGSPTTAFDADTGEVEWTVDISGSYGLVSSPTVAGGTVFVGDTDGVVYALAADSGDEHWTFETNDSVTSSPTVADGTVFVGSHDGRVYGLDEDTGEPVWEFAADAAIPYSPIVVDGVVFFTTERGRVHGVETEFEGHSEGSRVSQGTLNHHHAWTGESPQTVSIPEDAVGESIDRSDETPTPSTPTTPTPGSTPTPSATPTEASPTEGFGTGFGTVGTLAGIGAVGYLMARADGECESGDQE